MANPHCAESEPVVPKWSRVADDSKGDADRDANLIIRLPNEMIIRVMFAMALVSIISLCSCAKEKVESEEQLLGEWLLLDDPAKAKRIRLEAEGTVGFIQIQTEDLGIESKGTLPPSGNWKFSPEGNLVRFKFILNGTTYDHSGKIVRKKEGLEIRFGVGDPDDFAWKRFRLVKPKDE